VQDNSGFLDRDEIHELLIKLRQPPFGPSRGV
jgi:hypothetical protein